MVIGSVTSRFGARGLAHVSMAAGGVLLALAIAGRAAAEGPPRPTSGLRGALMSSARCSPVDLSPSATEPTGRLVPVAAVEWLMVCPGEGGRDGRRLRPGQSGFAALVAILATPDDTTHPSGCRDYANIRIQILAHTAAGVYWLDVRRTSATTTVGRPRWTPLREPPPCRTTASPAHRSSAMGRGPDLVTVIRSPSEEIGGPRP